MLINIGLPIVPDPESIPPNRPDRNTSPITKVHSIHCQGWSVWDNFFNPGREEQEALSSWYWAHIYKFIQDDDEPQGFLHQTQRKHKHPRQLQNTDRTCFWNTEKQGGLKQQRSPPGSSIIFITEKRIKGAELLVPKFHRQSKLAYIQNPQCHSYQCTQHDTFPILRNKQWRICHVRRYVMILT